MSDYQLPKRQTPEQRELEKKQAELATLEAELAERELEFATFHNELRAFEVRYVRVVGRLYAELDALEAQLAEPLSRLRGLVHYYVGIDRDAGYLINLSVWESLEAAHQMDTLQAMLAQRPVLEAAGVTFEVITNHKTLCAITP